MSTCRGGVAGQCIYGGSCRKSCVVYKATCSDGKYYIGSTQQFVKNRMGGHFDEVRSFINQRKPGDSFARHVAKKFEGEGRVSRSFARKQLRCVEVVWQGNPLSCVKTFKSLTCKLCSKERLHLYKARQKDKADETNLLINTRSDLYSAC